MPQERRTKPSVMPTLSRSSVSMLACVITCERTERALRHTSVESDGTRARSHANAETSCASGECFRRREWRGRTAGQVQMLSRAPRFSQRLHGRWIESISARPASVPPFTSNQSMPPCRLFLCWRSCGPHRQDDEALSQQNGHSWARGGQAPCCPRVAVSLRAQLREWGRAGRRAAAQAQRGECNLTASSRCGKESRPG
eukprot:3414619-Pleurochrysis_carterae.AAC.6